ncbi:hypothetical protein BT96DRAFT_531422 [Gymnopus androsaceus JB14]|uniref:Uncharacterized protein n=1 Tax=Gymnopus androsaceus JB14 TaxID=1447944 RepID=A0A6A4IBW7_9AGAR|nr:hypothetical protein BT96DRAFT_531422 [Gymnopus androsaceus JB14]
MSTPTPDYCPANDWDDPINILDFSLQPLRQLKYARVQLLCPNPLLPRKEIVSDNITILSDLSSRQRKLQWKRRPCIFLNARRLIAANGQEVIDIVFIPEIGFTNGQPYNPRDLSYLDVDYQDFGKTGELLYEIWPVPHSHETSFSTEWKRHFRSKPKLSMSKPLTDQEFTPIRRTWLFGAVFCLRFPVENTMLRLPKLRCELPYADRRSINAILNDIENNYQDSLSLLVPDQPLALSSPSLSSSSLSSSSLTLSSLTSSSLPRLHYPRLHHPLLQLDSELNPPSGSGVGVVRGGVAGELQAMVMVMVIVRAIAHV